MFKTFDHHDQEVETRKISNETTRFRGGKRILELLVEQLKIFSDDVKLTLTELRHLIEPFPNFRTVITEKVMYL